MRKILIILIVIAQSVMGSEPPKKEASKTSPNTVVLDDGNYAEYQFTDTIVGKTYTDKNKKIYPVYKTEKGKLYVWKKSAKTGKVYRYYLSLPK